MLNTIIKALIAAVKSIFGIKDQTPEPSSAELADKAATTRSTLQQEQAANDVLIEGSAARADAGATIVRDTAATSAVPSNGPSVNDTLKRDFPQDFRD